MIVSVENAREFISTNLSDRQLDMKLTALEYFIRKITNNDFQIRGIRSKSVVSGGVIVSPPDNVSVGDTIQITQSRFNNGIFRVTEISEHGMKTDRKLVSCMENLVTKVYYPPDVVEGTLNLLKWQIDNADKIGIRSEKLSRYSVTYSEGSDKLSFGYPDTLMAFLKPYMKARF